MPPFPVQNQFILLLTVTFKSIAIVLFLAFLDSTSKLCLKDLSKEVTEELTSRLNSNRDVLNRFYRSFGLDLDLLHGKRGRRVNIGDIFPDTPVKLLKEVFEALKLYDLAEFLEKVTKRRTLRPALPLKEIEKLSNANRPIKVYGKVKVLIIELEFCEASEPTAGNEAARRVGSFFKNLNSENEITSLTSNISEELFEHIEYLMEVKSEEEASDRIAEKREVHLKTCLEKKIPEERSWYLRKPVSTRKGRRTQRQRAFFDSLLEEPQLGINTKREEATLVPNTDDQLLSVFRKQEPAMRNELKELKEKREQWKNERKPSIEKEIKENKEELKKQNEKVEMAVSTVIDRWKDLQANDEGWISLILSNGNTNEWGYNSRSNQASNFSARSI